MEETLVIVVFAVVQSLFGIGLLVFGTPTLLLLGRSFPETLATLLPASIAISLLQIVYSGGQPREFITVFVRWCLVPLAVALSLSLAVLPRVSLSPLVALLLALFAVLRVFPAAASRATGWVASRPRATLAVMGAVHGWSNLGGALLMIFAAARSRRKEEARGLISYCYACFAAVQLVVLALFAPEEFGVRQIGHAALAATTFVLIGQRVFNWVSLPIYQHLVTAFAAAYAVLLGLMSTGAFE